MPDHLPVKFQALILMGVSGSGKTTIGRLFAQESGWDFIEGDDYHPAENIRKMSSGVPLTDADRGPWLDKLHQFLLEHAQADRPLVMTCSALKESYRRTLSAGLTAVHFIYLKGDFGLIEARLAARPGHYMKAGMLRSQFDVLQEPEDALTIDVTRSPQEICRLIHTFLLQQS